MKKYNCPNILILPDIWHSRPHSGYPVSGDFWLDNTSQVVQLQFLQLTTVTYNVKNNQLSKIYVFNSIERGEDLKGTLCLNVLLLFFYVLPQPFHNGFPSLQGNLFAPVVEALMSNYDRYNLLNSAILEMFEFIKIEDIKSLCNHVVENFSTTLNKITYVKVNTSPLFVII